MVFYYIIYNWAEKMVLYNWHTVYQHSQGTPSLILDILSYIINRPIPKNIYDVKIRNLQRVDWSGDSFLINPEAILNNRNHYSDKELAEYVGLASFRSLAEYKTTKLKTLPIEHSPVDVETLKTNRLLCIMNSNIYFQWEETKH